MGKYKLFNWKTLKREKHKPKNITVHRYLIPKGFTDTPGRSYAEKVYKKIKEYVRVYNTENEPSYFVFIVDEPEITKKDMNIIYDIACTGLTRALVSSEDRDDRAHRLGVTEVEDKIDMTYSNMKRWLNGKNKCEIVGMELVGWQKHWKRRMVR